MPEAEPKRNRTAAPTPSPAEPSHDGKAILQSTETDTEVEAANSDDGSDDEKPTKKPPKDEKHAKKPTKKPTAKVPSVATCVKPATKREKLASKEARYQSLLKQPAAAGRPRPNFTKVTTYHGGKIYWCATKNRLRVYKRSPGDKVESLVDVGSGDKKVRTERWNIACALIEHDPRPH